MVDLIDEQRRVLRHALGLDYKPTPYRNRYIVSANTPAATRAAKLAEMGLMRGSARQGGWTYWVTQLGLCSAIPGAWPALVSPPKGGWPGTIGSRATSAEWRAAVEPLPATVIRETPTRYEVLWHSAPAGREEGDIALVPKHRVTRVQFTPAYLFVLRRPGTVYGPVAYYCANSPPVPRVDAPTREGPETWGSAVGADDFRRTLVDAPAWMVMTVAEARAEDAAVGAGT